AGALLAGAVVVEYPAALAGVVIGIYAVFIARRWQTVAWLAAGAALPALALALYHGLEFGSPLALPYDFSTQHNRSQGFFMGLGVPQPGALGNILFSPYRGLFFSAPWLALAVPGAVRLWRARRAEAVVCLAIALLFVWLNASLVDWQGGWAMGPRYLVPAIPFLVVLVGGLLVRGDVARPARDGLRRAAWLGGGVLVTYSFAAMLLGTAVKPEVPVG